MKIQKKDKKFSGYEYPVLLHNPSDNLGVGYYIILAVAEDGLNIEGTILYKSCGEDKYSVGYHSDIFAKPKFQPYEGELILSNK
jgi:hypothetical protein